MGGSSSWALVKLELEACAVRWRDDDSVAESSWPWRRVIVGSKGNRRLGILAKERWGSSRRNVTSSKFGIVGKRALPKNHASIRSCSKSTVPNSFLGLTSLS